MIKKITTYITPFQLERTLHIALPDNYYETQVHYPVMYM
ncbi:alpha/beta hydrolase, partial [Coprobacillus cateniformis]|nr:alpha/beta hydrolase [Coprobacillus cateniformis]